MNISFNNRYKNISYMIKKITDKVWKINADSNVYFLDYDKKIIIDAGNRSKRQELKFFIEKVIDPKKIEMVILTHLHYDHVGCIDLFPNAEIYASKEAIEDFKNNPQDCVLSDEAVEKLKEVTLQPLPQMISGLQILNTPGHTRGSVCIWDNDKKILFSGDTIFDDRVFGRTDLPTSVPDKMMESIIRLSKFEYDHFCPGHDY